MSRVQRSLDQRAVKNDNIFVSMEFDGKVNYAVAKSRGLLSTNSMKGAVDSFHGIERY